MVASDERGVVELLLPGDKASNAAFSSSVSSPPPLRLGTNVEGGEVVAAATDTAEGSALVTSRGRFFFSTGFWANDWAIEVPPMGSTPMPSTDSDCFFGSKRDR